MDRITWTSKEDLLAMLDDPALILLDARYGKDWKRSDRKIRNAERLDAQKRTLGKDATHLTRRSSSTVLERTKKRASVRRSGLWHSDTGTSRFFVADGTTWLLPGIRQYQSDMFSAFLT
jgi:hypothetical protein